MEEIKKSVLASQLEEYKADPKNTILRHALLKNPLTSVSSSDDSVKDIDFNFDINIKTMAVSNQKQSGRCWIFAACNLVREHIAKEINVADFEISQSYIAFYDRLEKINYLLEAIIELVDVDYDDRTLSFLLQNGVGDGGQWDMFVSIVEKYGIVPKNVYPETQTSSSTFDTGRLINFNIRKFASDAHEAYQSKGIEAVRELKDEFMKKAYFLLVNTYGIPPETFDFEYTDKEGQYHRIEGFTPMSFKEKYLGDRLNDFVSMINAPTKDKPYNTSYTIKYLGNVVGGKTVTHVNVTMDRLKELVIAQLKDGQVTWFGSDVGAYGDRQNGVWDDNKFDYMSTAGFEYKMDKGESVDYHASQMNHAMLITGVALKDGVPTKWKIENSWGPEAGKAGYYIQSASWFDLFTYQAVVDKKYLNDEEKAALEKGPVVLKPWDPMGSLAD